MPSLLDPEAYGFANPDEDRRKKLSAQDVMSAVGGLLSQPVDYVKGRATSLLTDPIGDIQRTLQGTVERAKARDLLTQQAYGDPSNPLRVTDQAAADQLANEYLDMASTIMPMGMTVYHGSPYKFSAFDPTKIGSGEGAQAYGYGHYVAESPDVARQYKADRSFVGKTLSGSPSDVVWDAQKIAKDAIDIHGENAIPHLEGVLRMNSASKNKKQLAENKITEDALALLKSNAVEGTGSFYKVDLPDEQINKMLDWDTELGKQSKEVQDLAKQYGLNMDDLGGDLVAAMDAKRPAGAEAMRQAGVPGIKYFDAQSRGGQKADTRNFVVFPKNEGLLKIEEVNGQPVQSGLLDFAPEQKLYRVENPSYSNPNVGAVFYSPDKKYVDLYNSEGRLMREASMPDGVLDIRNKNDAKSIIKWVDKEYQNMLNEYDNGLPLSDEIKTIGKILKNKNPSTDEIGQALANITIGKWKMGYPRVSGIAEKELMDALGKDAMTMIEAGTQDKNNFSVAFRSSDIAKKYWKK